MKKIEKKSKKDKRIELMLKLLITLDILVIIIYYLSIISTNILYPAYLSYQASCNTCVVDENYVKVGSFKVSNDTPVITVVKTGNEEYDASTLRHEMCHYSQWLSNRTCNC